MSERVYLVSWENRSGVVGGNDRVMAKSESAARRTIRRLRGRTVRITEIADDAAYGRDHTFTVHSPHGDWSVVVSMYAHDAMSAGDFTGHAVRQLVPESQRRYVWYLTENGHRIPPTEMLACDRPRIFNLVMEMSPPPPSPASSEEGDEA